MVSDQPSSVTRDFMESNAENSTCERFGIFPRMKSNGYSESQEEGLNNHK